MELSMPSLQYYQYLFIKLPVAGADVALLRLASRSLRKVCKSVLAGVPVVLFTVLPVLPDVPFVLLVLLDVLFALLDALLPEAA